MDSLEYIDAYFGGEFSAEETNQFEKKIQEDPAFADEVAYYLSARVGLKEINEEERKTRFREIYERGVRGEEMGRVTERRGGVRRMGSRRWFSLAAAAAVLAVVVLAWLLFLRPADPSGLADSYMRK